MSGGSVPYHLRANKFIDRSIFMEFLMKFNVTKKLNDYRYIGFGAPHMEDFKIMHSLFSMNNLTCIEYDNDVHLRQEFNRPVGCIDLIKTTSGQFITDFEQGENSIFWLDYTEPSQIGQQLREFQQLLLKSTEYDVIKITLNANANSLFHENMTNNKKELYETRLEVLSDRLNENFPDEEMDITADMMTNKPLSRIIFEAIKLAYGSALAPVIDKHFHPITSFYYTDTIHQMITFTGIVINKANLEGFLADSGLSQWEYYIGDKIEPIEIAMPTLTHKERVFIDSLLPNSDSRRIQNELVFFYDKNENKSKKQIDSYIRFYRHYPQFSRVNM